MADIKNFFTGEILFTCDGDLNKEDLCEADLCAANLREADLCGADLCGANLRWADLRGAIGNGKEIQTIIADDYHAILYGSSLTIGCHQKDINDWLSMSDEEIKRIGPLGLWKKWRPVFEVLFEDHISRQ